jgi:hypothetical protein
LGRASPADVYHPAADGRPHTIRKRGPSPATAPASLGRLSGSVEAIAINGLSLNKLVARSIRLLLIDSTDL